MHVVLGSLPPVYAHGLSMVLRSSGLPSTVVPDAAQLPAVLADPHALVVVVPEAGASAVLPLVAASSRHAVVVLVEQADEETIVRALRAGVTGVITAGDTPDDVVEVLRCAARGHTVLPRQLVQGLCRPATGTPPPLTPAEQGWLRRLAAGGTVASLARSCGYSEREMYRRLSSVYLRLGAHSRTEAVLLAERFGLLDHRV